MQTLPNGVDVFTNSDDYNLAEDIASAFKSAGVIIPVPSKEVRDALPALLPGKIITVTRTDLPGCPTERWDLTKWVSQNGISYTPNWTGAESWGSSPIVKGTYWRNGNHVRVQAMIEGGAGSSLGLGVIGFSLPAGLPVGADFMASGGGMWNSFKTTGALRSVLTAAGPGQTSASVWAVPGTDQFVTPGNAGWPWGTNAAFHVWIEYMTDGA